MEIKANFDELPPRVLCPPGWSYRSFATRDGARVAADYWDENGKPGRANWLRTWAELTPDEYEAFAARTSQSWLTRPRRAKSGSSSLDSLG